MAEYSRPRLIEQALAAGIARQGAREIATLDLAQLAAEVETATGGAKPLQPLDPEGDGLDSSELNAANDV